MTKFLNDEIFDAGLDEIKDNANLMTLCSDPPTTRTEAVTTYALADAAMVTGDYTKANGDASGRKLSVGAKAGEAVDANGMATHIAHVDGTRLLAVTELTIGATGRANTCQGGSSTTIQFDAGASAVDDQYNDMAVTLIRADGSSETRKITDYVGSTKTATVASWTGTAPTSSDTFRVFGQQVTSGNTVDFPTHDIAEIADPTA